MADDEVDPDDRLREELDELHERLAALSGRMADLERDPHGLAAAHPDLLPSLLDLLKEAEAGIF